MTREAMGERVVGGWLVGSGCGGEAEEARTRRRRRRLGPWPTRCRHTSQIGKSLEQAGA